MQNSTQLTIVFCNEKDAAHNRWQFLLHFQRNTSQILFALIIVFKQYMIHP